MRSLVVWSGSEDRNGDGALAYTRRGQTNQHSLASESGVALRSPPQSKTLRVHHAVVHSSGASSTAPVAESAFASSVFSDAERLSQTRRMLMSAGETPEMRPAWAMV